MKKILYTFLIAASLVFMGFNNTCQAANVTDAEDFEIPEYTISLPTFFQNTKEEPEEEEWLSIQWNQWHADVNNLIRDKDYILYSLWHDNSFAYSFIVNNQRQLSEVIVYFIPFSTYDVIRSEKKGDAVYKANTPFYAYCIDNNTFYKLKLSEDIKTLGGSKFRENLSKSKISVVDEKYVPRAVYLRQSAENLKKTSGNKVYTYPYGSQRKKVFVYAVLNSVEKTNWKGFKASDYDDIERVKQ